MSGSELRSRYAHRPFAEWDDIDRANYILSDIRTNGLQTIDDDPWVVEFMAKAMERIANG